MYYLLVEAGCSVLCKQFIVDTPARVPLFVQGALDVESAADTVCCLLQCPNPDAVSAVLRHISECEVSPSILFTERGLCAIQVGHILCNP